MALRARPLDTKHVAFQSRECEPLFGMMLREPEGLKGHRTEGTWPCFPGEPGLWESSKKTQSSTASQRAARALGLSEASRDVCGQPPRVLGQRRVGGERWIKSSCFQGEP